MNLALNWSRKEPRASLLFVIRKIGLPNLTKTYFKYKVLLDLWPNMGRRLSHSEEIPVRFRAGKGHFSKNAFYLP